MKLADKYIEVLLIAIFSSIGASVCAGIFYEQSLIAASSGAGLGAVLGLTMSRFESDKRESDIQHKPYMATVVTISSAIGAFYAIEEYSVGEASLIGMVFSVPATAWGGGLLGIFFGLASRKVWQGSLGVLIGVVVAWKLNLNLSSHDLTSGRILTTMFLGVVLGLPIGVIFQKITNVLHFLVRRDNGA